MHAIGFIELGDYDKAADLLHRTYSRYVKEPFNVLYVFIINFLYLVVIFALF